MIEEQSAQKPEPVENIEPLLEVRHITKRFPGVVALNDVSVKFIPGEIHAVVGENGGEIDLMKIMAERTRRMKATSSFKGKGQLHAPC
jgi:ABC-type sugar transport system ATPase subunit